MAYFNRTFKNKSLPGPASGVLKGDDWEKR